jgi:hypothetical protein
MAAQLVCPADLEMSNEWKCLREDWMRNNSRVESRHSTAAFCGNLYTYDITLLPSDVFLPWSLLPHGPIRIKTAAKSNNSSHGRREWPAPAICMLPSNKVSDGARLTAPKDAEQNFRTMAICVVGDASSRRPFSFGVGRSASLICQARWTDGEVGFTLSVGGFSVPYTYPQPQQRLPGLVLGPLNRTSTLNG